MDTTDNSFERRIASLERRNRRMQNGMLFLALFALIPWTFAAREQQRPTGILRATELQLVVGDSVLGRIKAVPGGIAVFGSGNVKGAEITQDADGGMVRVFYADGRAAIAAGTTAQSSFLNLNGKDTLGVALAARKNGGVVIAYNPVGKSVVSMFSRPDSAGEVGVRSPESKWLGGIWGSASRGGALAVNNSAGTAIVNGFANDNGGQLMVSNNSGKGIGWLFANKDEAGSVQVGTGNGAYSANIQTFADGSGKVEVTNYRNVPVAALGIGSAGNALFSAAGSDGKPVFQAGSDEHGGYVSILNPEQFEAASLALQPSGRAMLGFMDPATSKRVMELFSSNDGARLQLYTGDGQLTHSVPDR